MIRTARDLSESITILQTSADILKRDSLAQMATIVKTVTTKSNSSTMSNVTKESSVSHTLTIFTNASMATFALSLTTKRKSKLNSSIISKRMKTST